MVTQKDIVTGLRNLGLTSGDTVVVHSSLSSFGEVEGGADSVVNAVLEVLGSAGTLVVPVFTYGQGIFDPEESPSLTGAVTEAARKRPDALRSLHPTHSVAAIGPLAQAITEGHEKAHPFGRGSALFKVLQVNGKILQLGTTHTSNSMIHVAEEIANASYLDRSRLVECRTPGGKSVRKWVRRPGCSRGFDVLEEPLQEHGAIRETTIGNCCARLMSARAVVGAAVEELKQDPEALLCDQPDCGSCAEARAILVTLEIERQDKEIIELAEEEERTLRLVEDKLGGDLKFFDPGDDHFSPN